MNPYYSNWNYGYTLAPASEKSRGAYNQTYATSANASAPYIKKEPGTERQKFVTSSQELGTSDASSGQTPAIGPMKPPELQQPSKDIDPVTSISRVHELAVANRLVERFDKIEDPQPGVPNKGKFVVKLYIGAEEYEGKSESLRGAKQQAAMLCLTNTKYQTAKEKKMSMFKTANRTGITATSELHELAAKKNIAIDFKFLEPFNFEFKASMRMWSKKEMLGNYRVQLTVGDEEFYGQAELPQQAKHNAAVQALDKMRKMKANHGEAKLVAKPGASQEEIEKEEEESAPVPTGGKNIMMLLNEVASVNSTTLDWELISETGPAHARNFTWELKMGEFKTIGSGPNKKLAKQSAADKMWATLSDDWKKKAKSSYHRKNGGGRGGHAGYKRRGGGFGGGYQGPPYKKKNKVAAGEQEGGDSTAAMAIVANNPISCLYEYAKKKKIADPFFNVINETVLSHGGPSQYQGFAFKKMEYTLECEIEGKKFMGIASNKKAAKTACAMEAWDAIKRENNI